MRPLDPVDFELIKLLKHNARATVTELAAALGVSRVTLKSRMASLRADGIIRRFTVDVAEPSDQDLIQAVSFLDLKLTKVEKVHRELKRMPEFTSLYSTNGKWALIANSETKNLAAFDELLNKIGKLDGVTNVETCLLLTRLL